jgi:hypothetical protein
MRKIMIFFFLLLLSACASKRPIQQVPVMTKITVKPRLIPVQMAGDSVLLRLLFECDSNNRLVLKKLAEQKSKGINSDWKLDDDGSFSYKANAGGRDTVIIVNDSIISKEVPVQVPVPYEVNVLFWYQKLLIFLGFLMVVVIVVKVTKYAIRGI